MRARDIRSARKAAREQDYAWQDERDDDAQLDGLVPADEHTSLDEFAHLAKEIRE